MGPRYRDFCDLGHFVEFPFIKEHFLKFQWLNLREIFTTDSQTYISQNFSEISKIKGTPIVGNIRVNSVN